MTSDRYTHGHHASVVDAHATRTIANSATYLEPLLTPGLSMLDVGCGPGSITAEFATRLGPGQVLGIDLGAEVIDQARDTFGASGAEFAVMDIYGLDSADASWDIVHAHQVLQHLSDPVAALAEMRRVVKPDGVVAVRDADYSAMHWAPAHPALDEWLAMYRAVAYANNAEPDAGRYLLGWARQAGFSNIAPSVSTWLFSAAEGSDWWGRIWSRRIVESALADQAVEGGHGTRDKLRAISQAWLDWAADPNAWFVVVHAELLCHP